MTAIVSIHQPNYLPWLGYFAKIARSDFFIFLDDVQYSKNSYINRVQVLNVDRPHWLTIPVNVRLGETIKGTHPSNQDWISSHRATLRNFYLRSRHFDEAWPLLEDMYDDLPQGTDIASINSSLIRHLCRILRINCEFRLSSEFRIQTETADDRLISLVRAVDVRATYLSGSGGRKYQDENKFHRAGIQLEYIEFSPSPYDQAGKGFFPGLSLVDAAFHIGWKGVGGLLSTRGFSS